MVSEASANVSVREVAATELGPLGSSPEPEASEAIRRVCRSCGEVYAVPKELASPRSACAACGRPRLEACRACVIPLKQQQIPGFLRARQREASARWAVAAIKS